MMSVMSVIQMISIIIAMGLLLVVIVYFYMTNRDVSTNSTNSTNSTTSKNSSPIEFSDDMSEKYRTNSSEFLEESESSEEEFPQFTTEQQFENAQSNIFNPKVQETEIRVWDDGYATQGLGVVGYK